MRKNVFLILFFTTFLISCVSGKQNYLELDENHSFFEKTERSYNAIDIADFEDGFDHARYGYPQSNPPWHLYQTTQILGFAENMVYLQNPDGGWAKNIDFQRKFTLEELKKNQNDNATILPVTYGKKKVNKEVL